MLGHQLLCQVRIHYWLKSQGSLQVWEPGKEDLSPEGQPTGPPFPVWMEQVPSSPPSGQPA